MWEYIVLGQIPGTSLQIGFYTFATIVIVASLLWLRQSHKQRIVRQQKAILAARQLVKQLVLGPNPDRVQMKLF